jgi:hypothetical protein
MQEQEFNMKPAVWAIVLIVVSLSSSGPATAIAVAA